MRVVLRLVYDNKRGADEDSSLKIDWWGCRVGALPEQGLPWSKSMSATLQFAPGFLHGAYSSRFFSVLQWPGHNVLDSASASAKRPLQDCEITAGRRKLRLTVMP